MSDFAEPDVESPKEPHVLGGQASPERDDLRIFIFVLHCHAILLHQIFEVMFEPLCTMDCNCRFIDCVDKKRLLKNQGCWSFQMPCTQNHPVIFSGFLLKKHVSMGRLFNVRERLSLNNRL